jgi:hypothetical protein
VELKKRWLLQSSLLQFVDLNIGLGLRDELRHDRGEVQILHLKPDGEQIETSEASSMNDTGSADNK